MHYGSITKSVKTASKPFRQADSEFPIHQYSLPVAGIFDSFTVFDVTYFDDGMGGDGISVFFA